jgi:hypothetical protein
MLLAYIDLLVETGKPALIFGDQCGSKVRAIARDRNLDLRGVRQNRPFGIAIAMIDASVVRLSSSCVR